MYKTLLLAFWLLVGTVVQVSAASNDAKVSSASAPYSLSKRTPKDKARSGRSIHRPNYKRYKGPGSPKRGFFAVFS
jgi:hypothetical protein